MNILHLCKNLNNLSCSTSPKNLLLLRKELPSPIVKSTGPGISGTTLFASKREGGVYQ